MNQLNLSKFTKTLGAGGFGIVKTGSSYPENEYAIKFLHSSEACGSAKKEFIIGKGIYDAFVTFRQCDPSVTQINIPEPIEFSDIKYNGYDCYVVMKRLFSAHEKGDYAIHLVFNDILPASQINKLVMRHYGATATGDNSPRGYFYNMDKVREYLDQYPGKAMDIETISDVVYRMGVLNGIIIFGARYIPHDVEYLLTYENGHYDVSVLDFGMATPINITEDNYDEIAKDISQKQELDVYFHPCSINPIDEQLKQRYIEGITVAYECFKDLILPEFYQSLVKYYTDCEQINVQF